MAQFDVIIVGGGLSGLSAAIHLQNEGLNIKLFESTDRVGGRVKTDTLNGFLLDRGFQIYITSYPEGKKMLDYNTLRLKHFLAGSVVLYKNKRYHLTDPLRRPLESFSSFGAPFVKFSDQLKILALRNRLKRLSIEDIFNEPEQTTFDYLKHEWHFSTAFINSFFKPFLGGIFLEADLKTSSRVFEFVFKMFSTGYAALPTEGMEAIPRQLAARLAQGTIQTHTGVAKVESGKVTLDSGEEVSARAILVATDPPAARRLLQLPSINVNMRKVKCLYFSVAAKPPVIKPFIMINGNSNSLINNIAVPSVVNPSYAPPGRHLISVSIVQPTSMDDDSLLDAVKAELIQLFGEDVRYWHHLRTYHIHHALPDQSHVSYLERKKIKAITEGVYMCGDHIANGSINAALESGRLVADTLSWDLALSKTESLG